MLLRICGSCVVLASRFRHDACEVRCLVADLAVIDWTDHGGISLMTAWWSGRALAAARRKLGRESLVLWQQGVADKQRLLLRCGTADPQRMMFFWEKLVVIMQVKLLK
ncbi:hypothetical protein RYX36_019969 [Vicia faba]